MAIVVMISRSLPLPLPLFGQSSHLRTRHLPARACSTVLRAVHPAPLSTSLASLLPPTWSNGNKIDGSDANLPSAGGAGGTGGSTGGKPGRGDEDDGSAEDLGVLNCIVELIRRLLLLAEPLRAGDFLATISSSIAIDIGIGTEHEINLMGDQGHHCDGSSNDQLKVTQDNHSDKRSRTTSKKKGSRTILKKNTYNKRTAQLGTRTNNIQDHIVDMHNSYDETSLDKNEKKMKGRRSYVVNMAAASLVGELFLVPYWTFSCSDPTLSIPKTWRNAVLIGLGFLIITNALVISHSYQFKDGELPDNAGFKLLQIVLAVMLLCLLAGLFIPLHVCRGMSNWVVWTCAAGALLMIVISWSTVFHHKMVIKCIKAPYQMVNKCTKFMYETVQRCLPDLSLP